MYFGKTITQENQSTQFSKFNFFPDQFEVERPFKKVLWWQQFLKDTAFFMQQMKSSVPQIKFHAQCLFMKYQEDSDIREQLRRKISIGIPLSSLSQIYPQLKTENDSFTNSRVRASIISSQSVSAKFSWYVVENFRISHFNAQHVRVYFQLTL